jgi:hypothetical protein
LNQKNLLNFRIERDDSQKKIFDDLKVIFIESFDLISKFEDAFNISNLKSKLKLISRQPYETLQFDTLFEKSQKIIKTENSTSFITSLPKMTLKSYFGLINSELDKSNAAITGLNSKILSFKDQFDKVEDDPEMASDLSELMVKQGIKDISLQILRYEDFIVMKNEEEQKFNGLIFAIDQKIDQITKILKEISISNRFSSKCQIVGDNLTNLNTFVEYFRKFIKFEKFNVFLKKMQIKRENIERDIKMTEDNEIFLKKMALNNLKQVKNCFESSEQFKKVITEMISKYDGLEALDNRIATGFIDYLLFFQF